MSLRINQNIDALNSYRNLSVTQNSMSKSLEKLSSGFRINRAADDAAGLAISEGLRAQAGGLKVAVRNAQDGISVVQTAEGALTETHSILQRMRTLAVQASNLGAMKDSDLAKADAEYQQLGLELEDIATKTAFNGSNLLDGSAGTAATARTFQVGANASDTLSVQIADMGASALFGGAARTGTTPSTAAEITTAIGTLNAAGASGAITKIDAAIEKVSAQRSTLGASQNRLEHKINNLNVTVENLTASESRIRDTDMATEMMQFTRAQILSQAGTAMLAQANQAPQGVLSLLR
jgi:flagellin